MSNRPRPYTPGPQASGPHGSGPHGPGSEKPRQPEVIYVRRRVAALLALLLVIALLIFLMVKFAGKKDDSETVSSTTTATSSSASSLSESSSESSEAIESSEAETSTSGTTEAEAPKKQSCELHDLRITATTDHPNYPAKVEPKFYMTVQNPTDADCEINLDRDILRFEVYDLATNQRVWADVDCNASEGTGTRVFPAGEERHFEAKWSRTTSAPEMCQNRQPVPPGSYFLHAVIGDNPSDAYTFNLG